MNNNSIFFLKCTAVGLLTGFIVIFYRFTLGKINIFRKAFFENLKTNLTITDVLIILLFVGLSSLFIAYIIKKYPMVRGGGVAFVKGDVESNVDFSSSNKIIVRDILYKLTGAILALSSGLSFGIEGPSIELGGEVGQGIGNFSKSAQEEKKYLITAGAAAGLAAAFNAPLTGIFFAFEQIIKTISPKYVMGVLISCPIVGWLTNKAFGVEPFFKFTVFSSIERRDYYLIIIFSLFVALIGKAFFLVSAELKKINGLIKCPDFVKLLIPFSIGIFVSTFFFDFTGEGWLITNKILSNNYSIFTLVLLLVFKSLYFLYSTSTDIPGGSFVPLISIGAIIGKLYGHVIIEYFFFPKEYMLFFIILGMSLLLTSIIRAPITGIILIIEITGISAFFYQLVLGTVCVSFFSRLFGMQPIYDSALKQYLSSTNRKKKPTVQNKKENSDKSDKDNEQKGNE